MGSKVYPWALDCFYSSHGDQINFVFKLDTKLFKESICEYNFLSRSQICLVTSPGKGSFTLATRQVEGSNLCAVVRGTCPFN